MAWNQLWWTSGLLRAIRYHRWNFLDIFLFQKIYSIKFQMPQRCLVLMSLQKMIQFKVFWVDDGRILKLHSICNISLSLSFIHCKYFASLLHSKKRSFFKSWENFKTFETRKKVKNFYIFFRKKTLCLPLHLKKFDA